MTDFFHFFKAHHFRNDSSGKKFSVMVETLASCLLGEGVKWKGAREGFLGVMEVSYTTFWVVVSQGYTTVKNH